jgi:hypothetical protein
MTGQEYDPKKISLNARMPKVMRIDLPYPRYAVAKSAIAPTGVAFQRCGNNLPNIPRQSNISDAARVCLLIIFLFDFDNKHNN